MGRPPKFSRDHLQAAALALVDRDGIEGLSMRALAGELGTGAMTLYNHVEHREDLEMLVVDAVVAATKWKTKEHEDWRDDVRAIATAMWRAVRAHPRAIPLVLTRRTSSPAVLEVSEALLRALARSGRKGRDLLVAFRALTAIVTGLAQVELAAPLAAGADDSPKKTIERVKALPEDRYPRLREIAKAASSSRAEVEFKSGLELLLAGLGDDSPARGRRRSRTP